MARLVDAFHVKLVAVAEDKLLERMKQLAGGSATQNETDKLSTGEKYAFQIGYIQAINDVLQWGDDIEADMYGNRQSAT